MFSFIKTVRNNWKKSVFGCVVLTYMGHYGKQKHDINAFMAESCREALHYGNVSYTERSKTRNVTVFLNPAANKRQAKKEFDKYCAPLLHLAGLSVSIVQTKSQGEARVLAEKLDDSVDAVIVAGGDGTLSEVITGLLRKEIGNNPFSKSIPVGILPLGQINAAAKSLCFDNGTNRVKNLSEATMAVIKEIKKPVDVMQLSPLEKELEDQRPIYSISGLRWGAVQDAFIKRDKYWYWGSLRAYVSYIFQGLKGNGKGVTWNCNAKLYYSLPCNGCSVCYIPQESSNKKMPTRWWQNFVPKQRLAFGAGVQQIDYSKIKNEKCGKMHDIQVSSVDLFLETSRMLEKVKQNDVPFIKVSIGPSSVSYWDFIARGWQYINGCTLPSSNILQVKDVKILPEVPTFQDHWFYIDNDDYEVKPIYIKLLPKRVLMFCKQVV